MEINEDHPIYKAIDRGGGQTCDIPGVLRELFAAGYTIVPLNESNEPILAADDYVWVKRYRIEYDDYDAIKVNKAYLSKIPRSAEIINEKTALILNADFKSKWPESR